MQNNRFTFSFSSLAALLAHAAPISMLERSDSLDARDGDNDLRRRVNHIPVGPGIRHPGDANGADFHRLPAGTYVETHDHVYTHEEVNDAAQRLIYHALPQAPDYTSNNERRGARRTYPKASSGFRPTEQAHDPAHGFDLAYHYPMRGMPGVAHRNPITGRWPRVGTDRIMAWKNHADTHYNIGVSYHDPTRPIPEKRPETSRRARNHPFSYARCKTGGTLKIKALKVKKAIQRTCRRHKRGGSNESEPEAGSTQL